MGLFKLQPDQVCMLMAKCRAREIRLQAVLTTCAQELVKKGLKAKEAMAWLMFKIGLKIDYDFAARQEEQRKAQRVRITRRQEWLKRMQATLLIASRNLPDGRKVMQESADIVTLCDHAGKVLGAMPSVLLVEQLCRHAPGWVRAVARGRHSPGSWPSAQPSSQETQMPFKDGRSDKEQGRATLAQIKAMLRQPRDNYATAL